MLLLVAPTLSCAIPGCSPSPSCYLSDYPPTPLAFAHITCCQVLTINGSLCRSLDHLSAPPHYMLGYGDLDLLLWIFSFSSWRSSPFEASFTKMALVGVCWSPDTLLSDALTAAACWLRLNALQLLGCRLLDPTQFLTAACGLEFFRISLWWWAGGTG